MQLTQDQMQAVKKGATIRVHEAGTDVVVMRADVLERLHGLIYDDGPWTDDEMDFLAAEDADRLGWDGMDAYQEMDR